MAGMLGTVLAIGYFGLGIIQWWATIDGLEYWFDISGFMAFILSGFIAYIPLIGTIAGFKGAMDVWGWDFMEAALLFFGPFGVIAVVAILGSILDKASSNRNE
jgi:hypothetical protein